MTRRERRYNIYSKKYRRHTREEWLERMGKGNLKTTSRYHDAYASKIFRKYHCEGIFEVKGSRFRLIVNDDTLSRLKKFENINYFVNG